MCLRPALHGGQSFAASSRLLYNFVIREHPEYLPILHKSFPTDWRSEQPPGSPGWYLEPLYSYFGGALSATVRTGRAMSAMRFPEVPRLTADEVSCFLYFDSLPKRPGVAVGMQFQTGDLQFLKQLRDRAHPHRIRRRPQGSSASTAPAATVDQSARNRPATLPRICVLAQRLPDVTGANQRQGRMNSSSAAVGASNRLEASEAYAVRHRLR